MVRMRRWVRIGLVSILGVLILTIGLLTFSAYRVAPSPARRDAAWGVEHVNGYRSAAKSQSVFGRAKKGRRGSGSRRVDPRRTFAR